ncbi:hypothetical protein NIES4071_68040 [Calothrix sp. NIES-4071]|nr:hypothetical protein NIES4071_68040 [Calothrix sp. NIES-4071]BAZ61082.1 hypothetical protein NIES4105_68000 [Calothrix sp. NIES-4105]
MKLMKRYLGYFERFLLISAKDDKLDIDKIDVLLGYLRLALWFMSRYCYNFYTAILMP